MNSSEVKLAIISDIPYTENTERYIGRQLAPYKLAASIAAKYYRNPDNYEYTFAGKPYWPREISVLDDGHTQVADHKSYNDAIEGTKVYPAVRYVLAAVRRAKQEVAADAGRWMSPTEVEEELGLKRGTVKSYIHAYRQVLEDHDLVRYPDKRSVAIVRGVALRIWGKDGQARPEDCAAYDEIIDWTSDAVVYLDEAIIQRRAFDAVAALNYTDNCCALNSGQITLFDGRYLIAAGSKRGHLSLNGDGTPRLHFYSRQAVDRSAILNVLLEALQCTA